MTASRGVQALMGNDWNVRRQWGRNKGGGPAVVEESSSCFIWTKFNFQIKGRTENGTEGYSWWKRCRLLILEWLQLVFLFTSTEKNWKGLFFCILFSVFNSKKRKEMQIHFPVSFSTWDILWSALSSSLWEGKIFSSIILSISSASFSLAHRLTEWLAKPPKTAMCDFAKNQLLWNIRVKTGGVPPHPPQVGFVCLINRGVNFISSFGRNNSARLSLPHSSLLTSKSSSGNGRAPQAKRFIGCQLSNANGWNETENIDLKVLGGEGKKKKIWKDLVKNLHQRRSDQSYAGGEASVK